MSNIPTNKLKKSELIELKNKTVHEIFTFLWERDILTPLAFNTLFYYVKELENGNNNIL